MRVIGLFSIAGVALCLPLATAQSVLPSRNDRPQEAGIPVTDPLVIAKCGSCHQRDARGNMERISWERATPEGWQEALKKTVFKESITLSPSEARSIVRYLSANHGLAPEEARPVMYYAERRIHDEAGGANAAVVEACTKCHAAARPLSWRRSLEDWKQLAETHVTQYKLRSNGEAIAALARIAPLHTPEWEAWSRRMHVPPIAGRWLVTAHVPGRGMFIGEMTVDERSGADEFTTRVTLRSIADGSIMVRAGQGVLYGGYAWRGRSRGVSPSISGPADLSSEAREAMWVAPDRSKIEGRWFWGQYQEFGFDVILQRPASGPMLLAMDCSSLKTGSLGNRVRLFGENMPEHMSPADVDFGPGILVRRTTLQNMGEILAEVDVAADAKPGRRDVTFQHSVLSGALAVYDRIDYLTVTPESSLAAFGNQKYSRGFQQFEAIGYQRGADGKPHTADDLELGPMNAVWSMEVFYAVDSSRSDSVGKVSSTGLFMPAADSPGVNHDVWVIATAVNEKNRKGEPLVGKGYLVVTIPEYMFNAHRYVRDLDRWIEEGTW
jgi:quinohemoprotein amine dehydrogenase